MEQLATTSEPIGVTRVFGQALRDPSPEPDPETEEQDNSGRPTNPRSLQTARGRGRKPPRGTGDNPFTLADIDDDTPTKSNGRLEGIPPTTFDGDRSRTIDFLTEFKSFMLMNDDARIAKNPIKRCSYFLSLVKGPNVKGWSKRQLDWLDKVREDPSELPWRMSAWQVLEREFRNAFVDYAEHERAQDQIRRLRMKDGNVDQYIAEFQEFADRGNLDTDEPSNLRLFARGLPTGLAETCIDLMRPQNFEQWTHTAQENQRAWLQKQALKKDYSVPQASNRQGNPQKGQFFWKQRGQNSGPGQGSSNRNLPPRDPNAMDTSATARKQ